MRLLSLELHGFKSFPERTKITFDAGMTVIVGPNGSGKSNISDAVKWVLGELSAKNIRGVKLEDVIFGGTDKRSAMGFAEVSLTIDNTGDLRIPSDYTEITVTRRYFRTGESEYMINGKPARRTDIVELFMNTGIGKTGYSIVGQGRISEIISQRSEDRRYIFEEAAGISKTRYKKQEAERHLADLEANLIRINDIFAVLEERVGPLEKEAAKARTYLDLYERKKALDVALAVYDIGNIAAMTEDFERTFLMAQHTLEMADDALNGLKNQQATLFARQEEAIRKSRENASRLTALREERGNANTERRLEEQKIEQCLADRVRSEKGIEQKNEALATSETLLAACQNKYTDCLNRQKSIETAYNEAKDALSEATAAADDLASEQKERLQEKSDCEKKLLDSRISLSSLTTSRTSLAERMRELENERREAAALVEESRQKLAQSEKTLSSYRSEATETQKKRDGLTLLCDSAEKEALRLTDSLNAAKVEMNAKLEQATILRRMEDHFEGYQKSVKYVLDAAAAGKLEGICGPLSKLISVEQKYTLAIETALGGNIQNIVTENEKAAKNAIAYLKRDNAGRATFYPLNALHAEPLRLDLARAKSFAGYLGVASELVGTDPKYREVIALTLGRTLVFDTLDHAAVLARAFGFTVRIVTLDGQLINAGGSYTGGSAKRESGILSRAKEIEALQAAAEEKKAAIASLTDAIAGAEHRLDEARTQLEKLNDGYLLLSALYKAEETSHDMIRDQLKGREDNLATLTESAQHLQNRKSAEEDACQRLENEIQALTETIDRLTTQINTLTGETEESGATLAKKNQALNDLLLQMTVAGSETDAAHLAVTQAENEIARIAAEKEALQTGIDESRREEERLRTSAASLASRCDMLDHTIETTQADALAQENEADDLGRAAQALNEKIDDKSRERDTCYKQVANLENKRSNLQNEKDKISERLWDDYELSYADALSLDYPPITAETRSKSVSEQNKLRNRIRELGPVNVGAVEEYAQVKEQYETQGRQIADLTASREKYSGIVSQLEQEMCQRFTGAFEEINKNFAVTFRDLFGGGSAHLSLTDPEHVLESGIEISVSPPGKLIKNLQSLSGGEQVFVAIAILLAIFKINPPPFCLLDEIESALDEVNVSRFASYAQSFCDKTQFIVISHRRGTMEAANTLYGVTMQERGVSRLLSINISEVEQKIGMKLTDKTTD